ncbi:hypothetical protein NHQ30_009433 [Ciborinia camelliae]|nr:hypothetical protein NHQ30_009433 [Ciborinia camelliae]
MEPPHPTPPNQAKPNQTKPNKSLGTRSRIRGALDRKFKKANALLLSPNIPFPPHLIRLTPTTILSLQRTQLAVNLPTTRHAQTLPDLAPQAKPAILIVEPAAVIGLAAASLTDHAADEQGAVAIAHEADDVGADLELLVPGEEVHEEGGVDDGEVVDAVAEGQREEIRIEDVGRDQRVPLIVVVEDFVRGFEEGGVVVGAVELGGRDRGVMREGAESVWGSLIGGLEGWGWGWEVKGGCDEMR